MITKKSAMNALTKKFPQECLILSFNESPSIKAIPCEWRNFGIRDNLENSAWYPIKLEAYSERLPWIYALLRRCLIGTAIFYTDYPNLIYIFHDSEDYYFYIGRPPLSCLNIYPADQLQKLPGDLIEFYQDIHNGLTFYPSHSMGPLPLEDQPKLINLYDGFAPPFLNESIGIFHNGAGDYLSVTPDINSHSAFIWWHEEPERPETNLDLWAVMDNWVSIFLEDTQVIRG